LDVDFDFSSSFSMDGRYMLTANKVGKASIWDLQDGKELVQWNAVDVRGRFVTAFGPKGKVATSSFLEDDVKIWSWSVGSTDKPRLEGVLEVPKVAREEEEELGLRINSVAFDHTGERVATTSWIGITSIWDTKSRKRLDVLKMDDPIWGATFSPDGSQLVLISRKNAFLWDRDFGKLLKPLIGGGQEIRSAQFSPDGKRIVTSSSDGIAAIWNSANGGLVREFRGPTRAYGRHTAAVFSPDGGRTAAVFSTPSAFVWEVNRPRGVFNVCQLSPYAANVTAFDVDQDNQRVVTAFDRSVNVRECASGRTAPVPLADTFDGAVGTFSPPIMAVAFDPSDPEDTRILTASGDHVEIWDRTTGRRISVIKGHSSLVLAAAYDRQGQRVVTGSQDKSARIWDAKSGEERLSLPHDAAVFAVAFSPDGQHVVTADADQTLRVWDAVEGDLQKSAELERWPYLVEFVDNERVFVIAAPPFVWTCADSACDNPWSTQRFELWEWRLSGHHQPVPFSNNDDVGLSTAGHNIRVGQEDHNIVLTPKKAEDAASARHPAKARLLLPAMEAAIKFVFPNQDSKRLTAVSRKGEVQMVVVPPNNWADLVRDAKKTVGSWDDVQQELTEEERRRLGLEIAE
jgi:WD40 repeat protein